MSRGRAVLVLLLALSLAACAPLVRSAGPDRPGAPYLSHGLYIARDGVRLPYRTWRPGKGDPKATAVIVAVHGFNDYSKFFARPGRWLAHRGILSYAYDQRGFGLAPEPGIWAGTATYARDLTDFVALVERRHPKLPVYVLGDSMGGGVVLVAFDRPTAPPVAGTILVSPAVWGRATMPFYQRWLLAVVSHLTPGATLSTREVHILPSDNIPMLIALGHDPLVIKKTRVDAVWGVVNLMDAALAAAPTYHQRLLLLYGKNDQIIPDGAIEDFIHHLPPAAPDNRRIVIYPDHYHMMLRDLHAKQVWGDILAWIRDPAAPPPSQREEHRK